MSVLLKAIVLAVNLGNSAILTLIKKIPISSSLIGSFRTLIFPNLLAELSDNNTLLSDTCYRTVEQTNQILTLYLMNQSQA